MSRRRAFTLVELLVVIAIIAILAALIFPVFARAKGSARQTQCINNMKQVGTAIDLYMGDYDDIFPSAVDPFDKFRPEIWDAFPEFKQRIPFMPLLHEALQPYLKNLDVFHCPSDVGSQVMDNHPYIDFDTSPSMFATYGTSYAFRTEIAFKYFSQTGFQLPANVNVLFDGSGHWHGSTRAIQKGEDMQTVRDLWRGYRYTTLFGDLHAKSITFYDLEKAWQTPL